MKNSYKDAMDAAREFVKRGEDFERAVVDSKYESNGHQYYSLCPAESGAFRRQSMELTRALARMRNPR